jgi:protein SCO1/2
VKNKLPVLIPAIILLVGIAIAYTMIKDNRSLPVYSPSLLNPELVDESMRSVNRNHRIGEFELIDQQGKGFSEKQLKDKVYVADFFFTTCPTICPDMSGQLKRVQEATDKYPDFRIVSHTVQPEVDSPAVLQAYAERYEANPDRWIFLTGDKRELYRLARKQYFAATTEGDGGVNDFIHTENFVLVDKEKRIRGFYDGTSAESVDKLIEDIEILYQEYE